MSIEKYEKCKIPTCPAIANIPEYDSASYAQKKKFDEHAATAICKKGFDIYGKATTKDVPFPKSLKQCYDTFIVEEKDKKTYMSLFILDCEKNCRDSGKKKEITFETNTKKEYTTCLATKDCKQGDD